MAILYQATFTTDSTGYSSDLQTTIIPKLKTYGYSEGTIYDDAVKQFYFNEGINTRVFYNNQTIDFYSGFDIEGQGLTLGFLTTGYNLNLMDDGTVSGGSGTPSKLPNATIRVQVEDSTTSGKKFLDKTGLTHLWTELKAYFQDKLVSGTNIKTINNESLLGSGNIDIQGSGSSVFIATYGTTSYQDVVDAINAGKTILISYIQSGATNIIQAVTYRVETTYIQFGVYSINGYYAIIYLNAPNQWGFYFDWLKLASVNDIPTQATDTTLGTVKLNPNESVTLNSNGQLDIGGRLGAFSGTTGIFHSKDREPRKVGDFTLLITDAKGMESAGPRNFTLMTGNNLSLNGSHAAGSTQYKVTNNYANRIICASIKYIALNESSAKQTQIIKVTSVTIGGSAYTPNSSANDSSNPIIINAEASVNPSSAITQIRVFSAVGTGSYCSEYVGQCAGGDAGGDCLIMGQNVFNKSGNMNAMVGQSLFNTGNGNAIFGRQHISRKNRSFLAGTGHDTTNAKSESVSALGEWSDLSSSETLFAIGDGTSATDRSNAFEVRDQCIVLKSPNGTKWKIAVDNTGNLTATAI